MQNAICEYAYVATDVVCCAYVRILILILTSAQLQYAICKIIIIHTNTNTIIIMMVDGRSSLVTRSTTTYQLPAGPPLPAAAIPV